LNVSIEGDSEYDCEIEEWEISKIEREWRNEGRIESA